MIVRVCSANCGADSSSMDPLMGRLDAKAGGLTPCLC